MSGLEEACRREVVELHDFFEAWFTGALPDDAAAFERFAGVMAPGFAIVSPEGRLAERAQILDAVRSGHGSAPEGLRITVENAAGRALGDGLQLVTYEEWHARDGDRKGRLSSAVLRARDGLPNGVEWLHVHETWLPDASVPPVI